MRIEETSEIKITCHKGFEVQMMYLERVIQKFENGQDFFLEITLMDNGVEKFDTHAVELKNV